MEAQAFSGDGTYAPKSPDLSSFYSAGPTAERAEPQQLFLSQPSQPNFLHLQSPSTTSSATHQQQPHARHQSHPSLATFPQLRAQAPLTNNANISQAASFSVGGGQPSTAQHEYYPPRSASYPITGYPQPGIGTEYASTQAPLLQQQQPFYQPPYRDSLQYQQYQPSPVQQYPTPTSHLVAAQAQARPAYDYPQPTAGEGPMPPRRAAAAAAAAAVASQTALEATSGGGSHGSSSPPSGPSASSAPATASASTTIEPSPVKTKFPTARIKRIMQADEEVGKVAQQTPIAVGKALELFMVALVTKSAEVARQRNSKRVSAQMLKQVVEGDDQWDFLRDIVAKVEGEEKGGKGGHKEGGSKVKAESSETDEEMGDAAPASAKKKTGRGGGRKKKV